MERCGAERGECEASEATRGQAKQSAGTNACSAAARQGRQNRIARTYTAFDDTYLIHDREREAGGGGRESRKNRKTPANQRMKNKSEKKGRARDGLDWPSEALASRPSGPRDRQHADLFDLPVCELLLLWELCARVPGRAGPTCRLRVGCASTGASFDSFRRDIGWGYR